MGVVDQIIELFNSKGGSLYFGEEVTEAEHALQAAHLARTAGAPNEVIAGALLHDIGHLLHGLDEDIADHGVDGLHEDIGAEWLEGKFSEIIVDCVRLHVAAKRYLTAIDPDYFATLSAASIESLKLQGGPFNDIEVKEFQNKEPNFEIALQVRRWDDEAKVVGLDVPPIEDYRDLLESLLLDHS